jgi:cobalt transporter subunit CbtB
MAEMEKFSSGVLTADTALAGSLRIATFVSARVLAAAIAMLLGTSILFVAGFSSNNFLHAAAHDVRHSSGFPCH